MPAKLTPKEAQALAQCVIFKGIEPVQTIAEQWGEKQRFDKGAVIYSPQKYKKSLGILLYGIAQAEKNNGALVLNTLCAADCFGAAALFAPSREYVSTIRAKTGCTVLFFSDAALEQLFTIEPKLAMNYIAFLSSRIQFLNRKIDSFTAQTPEESIWLCLTRAAPPEQERPLVPVTSYSRLAESLNMSRSSLYRGLRELEERGVLQRDGKNITLLRRCGEAGEMQHLRAEDREP